MNNLPRSIFLFGAGAALDWKGPSTWALTDLIRNSGFKINGNQQTITDFIYNRLLANGYEEREVNFETIINVLEELVIYYSSYGFDKSQPSLLKVFFTPNDLDCLLNFSIVGGDKQHGYRLAIPDGEEYPYAKAALRNENPEQLFFQYLIIDLLSIICAQISKYAFHTPNHSVILTEQNSNINNAFVSFMQGIEANDVLRMYTLNYDRIFKILLEKHNIKVFEGFESGAEISYSASLRADLIKIYTDLNSNVLYNLHGSAQWEVAARDARGLPNPEVVLTGLGSLPINNEIAFIQVEKGKTILVSNIITGYQKAQKSFLPPFKQMQFSFERDCLIGDNLYIIGYSFGDEHINSSIKAACKYNRKLTIHIIDPLFKDTPTTKGFDKLQPVLINIFPELFGKVNSTKISENHISYFDDRLNVYSMGLAEFLDYNNSKNSSESV